jgi:vitamin B12 transporter
LQPEVSNEVQIAARYRPTPRQTLRLELYRNDIDDLIDFDLASFMLQNINRAKIRGAQLGWRYEGEAFEIRTDLVSQRADNSADGTRLLRRAEESLSVNLSRLFGEHVLGISLLASGSREDFADSWPG